MIFVMTGKHNTVGQVLGKKAEYLDDYHSRHITHNHAVALIDGRLQVVRRKKLPPEAESQISIDEAHLRRLAELAATS